MYRALILHLCLLLCGHGQIRDSLANGEQATPASLSTSTQSGSALTVPMWKTFSIDELPEGIDPDEPVILSVRTAFKGSVRFVDADNDFEVDIRVTKTGNTTHKLADIVDYKLENASSDGQGQAMRLQVLEKPEESPLSNLLKKIGISVGLLCAVMLIIIIVVVVVYAKKRRAKNEDDDEFEDHLLGDNEGGADKFDVHLKKKKRVGLDIKDDEPGPSWKKTSTSSRIVKPTQVKQKEKTSTSLEEDVTDADSKKTKKQKQKNEKQKEDQEKKQNKKADRKNDKKRKREEKSKSNKGEDDIQDSTSEKPISSQSTETSTPAKGSGKGGVTGKSVQLTLLTVACIAVPTVYGLMAQQVTVDITIHVPKNFLRPGVQVYFHRMRPGQLLTDGWEDPVTVAQYDVDIIGVDVEDATASNCSTLGCTHGCDIATGSCVCQRGYTPVNVTLCEDTNECEIGLADCDVRATCYNSPGDYTCRCDDGYYGDGVTCRDCNGSCPMGFYEKNGCTPTSGKECIECTAACPSGLFISKSCDNFTDIECQICKDSCEVWQYESITCGGTTDRECRDLTELFPIQVSDNVMVENMRGVTTKTEDIDARDSKILIGRNYTFDRGSGYTVHMSILDADVHPLYESVNHSQHMDLHPAPSDELKQYCEYPLPDSYVVSHETAAMITTLTKEDPITGRYYRSAVESCTTSYGYTEGNQPFVSTDTNALPCAEPSTLSKLFKSDLLSNYTSIRVDETESCFHKNQNCSSCSERCANSFDHTNRTDVGCRLPANEAALMKEGSEAVATRMRECFRCCMLGNCTICDEYHDQCPNQIRCRTGNIMTFKLNARYSFTVKCHLQPKRGSVIYRLQYQILHQGELVHNKTMIAERIVDNSRPGGIRYAINRHNFFLVKHGTGMARPVKLVRRGYPTQPFEAGEITSTGILSDRSLNTRDITPREPFGVNTRTWHSGTCDLDLDTLHGDNVRWKVWSDVSVTHTPGGYSISNSSAQPYLQLVLPQRLSVLESFYGATSLVNDRTLRVQLLRNDSFWIIQITGQVDPCPGLLRVHIRAPEYDNVTLFHYAVGVACPKDFNLELLLPTSGPDIHEKRLLLELRDAHRSINITLYRPPGSRKYNFGQPKKIEFNFSGFLISLVPFMIGTAAMLIALILLLIYGYCTRPDPLHRGRDNRLHKRHLLFVVWFVVFKFAYSLLVTVTEFALITRAIHSSTLAVMEQYPDYHRMVAHYETIELDKIRIHLDNELQRQEMESIASKRICELQLETMQKRVQEAQENLLKVYYDTIGQLDIADVAFQRVKGIVSEYSDRLDKFEREFNNYARGRANKLIRDIRSTYNDVKNNGWLVGARIIHGTIDGLCFGCLPSFIDWVGLDLDFNRIRTPDLQAFFPRPNLTSFSKPEINRPSIPNLPSSEFNPISLKDPVGDFNSTVDPKYYKKYVPNPQFNFFLNLLKENSLLIILLILDGVWFAYRASKTYATVVQLLHGYEYVIDVAEETAKVQEKEESEMSRGEKIRAAVLAGSANLTDKFLDLLYRLFLLLKLMYFKITNSDLIPQLLIITFLILSISLIIIITENMMDVETLWNLGYFHLKVAPIVASRKVTNTRIKSNAFKINNLEYPFYETLVNLRLKKYKILLKTYNRLMCERTSFQAVEYCAWWEELHPGEPCEPPVLKPVQLNFTSCELPPVEPFTYTDFDSLAYRLELKRSMEPYIAALQTTILHSFVALGVLIIVLVLIGALGQAVTVLLKRFDLVRLLKLYNLQDDPSRQPEYLPECMRDKPEGKGEKDQIGAVEINTELFGERKHAAPAKYIQF